MAHGSTGVASRHLDMLFRVGVVGGLTDRQLLERFLDRRDGTAAEMSFTMLVERHGPMVLRVCRGVLDDPHDAQDAFQATFLILVKKAGSIRQRDSLASWLFGVAGRVARRAKVEAARRRTHERRRAEMSARTVDDPILDDLGPVLHEEVGRLSETYRAAVVLCDLEGLSHVAAARQLRWPLGTLKTRLLRGRARLRQRLLDRGLALPAGLAVATLAPGAANAAVPGALMRTTVRTAMALASGPARATVLSVPVVRLMEGVLGEFVRARLRTAVLVGVLLTLGASQVARPSLMAASEDPKPATKARAVAPEAEKNILEYEGRTAYDPDTVFKIRPRFSGRVTKVEAALGQKVKRGDPLVELSSAQVARAKNVYLEMSDKSKINYERYKQQQTQFERGIIARETFRKTQADAEVSEFNFLIAQEQLRAFRLTDEAIAKIKDEDDTQRARITLRAPSDGLIIERDAVPSRDVNEKDPLMVLAALDHLWVVASVATEERDRIRVGQGCEVLIPGQDERVRGTVEFLRGQPDQDTGRHRIRMRIPNPGERLKADMLVRVRIELSPVNPPRPSAEPRKSAVKSSQFDTRDAPIQ